MSQSINKNNLKNKTAVITGGTRGIGKAISAELGRRGVNLILNYLRNHKEAKKTQKELNESNVNCSIYRCNIGDIESVDKFINKIALEHNKIDILINNAASGVMKKSTDLGFQDLRKKIPEPHPSWVKVIEEGWIARYGSIN